MRNVEVRCRIEGRAGTRHPRHLEMENPAARETCLEARLHVLCMEIMA